MRFWGPNHGSIHTRQTPSPLSLHPQFLHHFKLIRTLSLFLALLSFFPSLPSVLLSSLFPFSPPPFPSLSLPLSPLCLSPSTLFPSRSLSLSLLVSPELILDLSTGVPNGFCGDMVTVVMTTGVLGIGAHTPCTPQLLIKDDTPWRGLTAISGLRWLLAELLGTCLPTCTQMGPLGPSDLSLSHERLTPDLTETVAG